MQADTERVQRPAAKLGQAQLDQVFLGRDHNAIRCLLPRPSAQSLYVRSRIRMMIGVGAERVDLGAEVEQGSAKSVRVAQPAKRRDGPPAKAFRA